MNQRFCLNGLTFPIESTVYRRVELSVHGPRWQLLGDYALSAFWWTDKNMKENKHEKPSQAGVSEY